MARITGELKALAARAEFPIEALPVRKVTTCLLYTSRAPDCRPHHFTIYAKAPQSDVYSGGVRITASMGQTSSVRYEIKLKKSFVGRRILEAWVQLDCPDLDQVPPLELRIQRQFPPLYQSDGRQILETEHLSFHKGRAKINIPTAHCGPGVYGKLFLKDATYSNDIRLLPAEKDKLALG